MVKRILIDAQHLEETRVVIADHSQIYDFDFVSSAKKQVKGNIYLAKITRVEPSLQAAFVEYGGGKQGFLPFSEIHADYYQIPISDRKRLMAEVASDDEDDKEEAADTAIPADDAEAPALEAVADDAIQHVPLAPAIDINEHTLPEPTAEDEATPYFAEKSTDESVSIPAQADLLEGHDPLEAAQAGDSLVEGHEARVEVSEKSDNREGNEEVETIANDDDYEEERPKKNTFFKRYKIQEVIRRGQIVLVQVIKEERGNKGVSLTTYLSLAGRYCVLMPNSPKDGGISRKIASADDRKRLKAISTELRLAQGMSVIIRTAGMDRSRAEIKRDFDYLVKLWNHIRDNTLSSSAPALIYEESDIIKRAIRDQYANDIDEVIVQGDAGYRTAKDFMKMLLPSHVAKVKQHKDATPLFYTYDIEEQLLSMHDPVVKLPSGGYIVINPTEALISIDVNSGRSTGERNIEETAAKTNLEAAQEVARQLRLRDLAGLIVIDFIDMMESRHRRAVEKTLKDSLKADRAKIQLGRISPFGLLEMSRQRLRPSIAETSMVQCTHCSARGYVRSNESMSIQIIRSLEKEASTGSWGGLRVIAPQHVALYLLNGKREVLRGIEERYGISVLIAISTDVNTSDFSIEKTRRPHGERGEGGEPRRSRGRDRDRDRSRHERATEPASQAPSMPTYDDLPEEEEGGSNITEVSHPREEGGSDQPRRSRGRRRRGGRRGNGERGPQNSNAFEQDTSEPQAESAEEGAAEPQGEEGGRNPSGDRPRRERGGRGRRRWREGGERGPREVLPEGDLSSRPDAPLRQEERMPVEQPTRVYPVERVPVSATVVQSFAPSSSLPAAASGAAEPPRDPSAPPKKGWWKKMIDLDD